MRRAEFWAACRKVLQKWATLTNNVKSAGILSIRAIVSFFYVVASVVWLMSWLKLHKSEQWDNGSLFAQNWWHEWRLKARGTLGHYTTR